MKIFIFFLFLNFNTFASETDSWTYRNIDLEDSSEVINNVFNTSYGEIIEKVNKKILTSVIPLTDTEVEYLISNEYFNTFFYGDLIKDVFSSFEECIDSGLCGGELQNIERISLLLSESVYSDSNYSKITKKHLASQIQLCSVRLSTDKLTHMLNDGFRFYNLSKQDNTLTENDIEEISLALEYTSMGADMTGIVSYADIEANLAGYRLFNDIMSKHMTRSVVNGQIYFVDVDLCDYISSDFDETILKNKFTQSFKKVRGLKSAIRKRQSNNISLSISKKELLRRKIKKASVTTSEILQGVSSSFLSWFKSKTHRKALDLYYNSEPDLKKRSYFVFKTNRAGSL